MINQNIKKSPQNEHYDLEGNFFYKPRITYSRQANIDRKNLEWN